MIPPRAVFFDMDRTLLRVNSALPYARWQLRRGEATRTEVLRVLWWLAQYSAGVADVDSIARGVVKAMEGRPERPFADAVRAWVLEEMLPEVSSTAHERVRSMRQAGYHCAMLTSSSSYIADPLAEALEIPHVLASRVVVRDGFFTGEVATLAYGMGKVRLAEAWAQEHGVRLEEAVFYTDSISDLPMLEHVGTPIVVNPDPRLRFVAARRGWTVERW